MINIKNLTKIYLYEMFSNVLNRSKKTKRKTSAITYFSFILLFLLLFGSFLSTYYGYILSLKPLNLEHYILYFGLLYLSLMSIAFLSFQSQNLFYKTKDYEQLSTLPIKPKEIIISKIISLVLVSYLYQIVFYLPAVILYFIFAKVSVSAIIFIIISFFILPVFTLFISSILSTLVNVISSKSQNKEKTNTAILMIFMILLIFGYVYLNSSGLQQIIITQKIPNILRWVFPLNSILYNSIINQSFLQFFGFVLASVALLIISIYIFSVSYIKINQNYKNQHKTSGKKSVIYYTQKTPFASLIKLETKTFFNYPIYVINNAFGTLLLIIAAIALPILFFINKADIIDFLNIISTQLSFNNIKYVIALIIPLSTVGLTNTTSASVSIEGQMHYYRRSLPINFKDVVFSKLLINIFATSPLLLYYITMMPVMIILKLTLFEIFFIFTIPVCLMLLVVQLGLIVNLLAPKMQWTNENAVVKQSMSVAITMLSSIAIIIAISVVLFAIKINLLILSALILLVLLVLNIVLFNTILKQGEKLYNNI